MEKMQTLGAASDKDLKGKANYFIRMKTEGAASMAGESHVALQWNKKHLEGKEEKKGKAR